jgi:hypothetical protein
MSAAKTVTVSRPLAKGAAKQRTGDSLAMGALMNDIDTVIFGA